MQGVICADQEVRYIDTAVNSYVISRDAECFVLNQKYSRKSYREREMIE